MNDVAPGQPRGALKVLPMLLPLPAHFASLALLMVAIGGFEELAVIYNEGGSASFQIMAAGLLVAVVNSVLLGLLGFGRRLPAALPVLLALTPALLGALALGQMMPASLDAIAHLTIADKATIAAAAFSEAIRPRELGMFLTAAQLGAAGLGLALCAAAYRAEGRRVVGLVAGLAGAAALVAAFSAWPDLGAKVLPFTLGALVAGLTLAIGAASAGDTPSARLSGAAAVATVFSLVAASLFATIDETAGATKAMAHVAPIDKATIVAAAAFSVHHGGRWLLVAGAGAAGVAAVATLVLVARRGGAVAVAAGLGCAIAGGAVVGFDLGHTAHAAQKLADAARPFEHTSLDGVQLLKLEPQQDPKEPHVVIESSGTLRFPDGTKAPLADAAKWSELLRPLLAAEKPKTQKVAYLSPEGGAEQSELVVAVDERVSREAFVALMAAAAGAGATRIAVMGDMGWRESAEKNHPHDEMKIFAEFLPFAMRFFDSYGQVSMLLPGAAGDEVAMSAKVVGKTIEMTSTEAEGSISIPLEGSVDAPAEPIGAGQLVSVSVADHATVADALRVAARVVGAGFLVVLR